MFAAAVVVGVLALAPSALASSTGPPPVGQPPSPTVAPAATAAPSVVGLSAVFDNGMRAVGSGIVLTATGEVLTCDHVIDHARTVTATSSATGRSYPATLVGLDRTTDAAVIQLHDAPDLPTASGLQPAPRGTASPVAGEDVTAVTSGGPGVGAPTVTPGKVTALDQSITLTDSAGGTHRLDGLIEFHAALRRGDSGSALVNDRGEVVGMIVAASHDPAEALGAAVPIDRAVAAGG
ncbi:S1C family serine protease [Actinomycetospora sp. TBRC 11914]|uniref:S1C family serine protease n=1 Tax=Actinomycetospora sp. TBRC 11914 TaxID=2729387 RepID=UPI00145DA4D2|nr:trypsin-like peptidase domain-containing protein [Actinomycetospora sp. TBRC 11914]NMO92338.1 trypsin-like serine protease [Actinomycetospora sp. TBRC 11914]